jgi:hypothetical protein
MRLTVLVLISLAAVAPGAPIATRALAQPASPVVDDAVEQRIERLERAARDFAPAKPSVIAEVQVGGPGAEMIAGVASDPMAGARGGDLREGAAVIDVRGRIAYTPAGWVFAADPVPMSAESEDTLRVVLRLLPSPTSERLREIVADRSDAGQPPATFRVSGRVLVDRGRVYLLPVFATVLEVEEAALPELELIEPVDVDAETSNPDDPSVRELIERIERASDAEREGVREIFAGGGEGSSPGIRLLTGRVARLGRASDGRLIMAFEASASQRPGDEIDRAAVLPCRLYGALEQIWASRGDGARLLVSGEAFRDSDRWFLLPSLVEVERAAPSGLRTLR